MFRLLRSTRTNSRFYKRLFFLAGKETSMTRLRGSGHRLNENTFEIKRQTCI